MNILLAHDTCARGGHTSFMLDLAAGLRNRGHRVLCYFHEDGGYFRDFELQSEAARGTPAELAELLRRESFDVVHGDSCMLDLGTVLRRSGFSGRRVITRHAVNAPAGWIASRCDAYVAVSPSSAREMQPLTDLAVTCIPNGVDTDMFRPTLCPPPARRIIAWCGRSRDRFKNLELLLQVAARLDADRYEVHVADGDDAAPPANLPAVVTSWRRYERSELPAFFARVAASGGAMLHTAHTETQGLALLEALACGCPVFARDAAGVVDVLGDELDAWLYPADSGTEAVEAVHRFVTERLDDPSLLTYLDLAVNRVRREFSRSAMVEAYEALYQSAPRCRDARREAASCLWRWARTSSDAGSRPRDVLFAARAAAELDPTGLRPARVSALLRWLSHSRWEGARSAAEAAAAAWRDGRLLTGLRCALRALRLHPAALLWGR